MLRVKWAGRKSPFVSNFCRLFFAYQRGYLVLVIHYSMYWSYMCLNYEELKLEKFILFLLFVGCMYLNSLQIEFVFFLFLLLFCLLMHCIGFQHHKLIVKLKPHDTSNLFKSANSLVLLDSYHVCCLVFQFDITRFFCFDRVVKLDDPCTMLGFG